MNPFVGKIPSSKSIFNRLLIIQSYFPHLKLSGTSESQDVLHLRQLLADFLSGAPKLDAGEAGTSFRFAALRISRKPGTYFLQGSRRLLARPQDELVSIFSQLGVEASLTADPSGIQIITKGWVPPKQLKISANRSSQFASAILLNAWELPFDLEIHFEGTWVSEGYFQMTKQLCVQLGMNLQESGTHLLIPRHQSLVKEVPIEVEADVSSIFPIVVAGLLRQGCEILNWPKSQLQPDRVFVDALKRMKAVVTTRDGKLIAEVSKNMVGTDWSFRDCPDLFPVFAVLAAFCAGRSTFKEFDQIVFKESDRLIKTMELLGLAGVPFEKRGLELVIEGQGFDFKPRAFSFNPDQDHRMAMAAGIFRLRQPGIEIQTPQVVAKSFPEFWQVLQ